MNTNSLTRLYLQEKGSKRQLVAHSNVNEKVDDPDDPLNMTKEKPKKMEKPLQKGIGI